MHKVNIETLRDEAQRQLKCLKALLLKAQEKGLIKAPAQKESERATLDIESVRQCMEVLDGESHKLANLDLVLAVVGTMKAGKSTSINAIVGAEVLPNRNRPMTALPTLIRHTPGAITPRLFFEKVQPLNDLLAHLHKAIQAHQKSQPEILQDLANDADMRQLLAQIQQGQVFASQYQGEAGIFEFLKGLNDLVRLSSTLEVDFPFDQYATVDAFPVIEVEFSHLKNTPATQGRLTLLDTPGPNEAGQAHLRAMLKDQLKKSSAVLAVLDYTQLKSNADEEVRQNLLEIADTAKDRMYALINKFDQKDRHGDDADSVKRYVAQTLMKGVMAAEHVFPVSSKHGYLASRSRNELARHGQLNVQEPWVKDFAEEAFGRLWGKCLQDPQEVQDGADVLWQESGFSLPLEQVVVRAHQNAALEALRSAASKLMKWTKDGEDFFKVGAAALQKDAKVLKDTIDKLAQDIENIKKIEAEIADSLKKGQANIQNSLKQAANELQRGIRDELEALHADSEERERRAKARKEKEASEKPSGGPEKESTRGRKAGKTKSLDEHFDEVKVENGVVSFDKENEAHEFRERIEKSIEGLFHSAESSLQGSINSGIDTFRVVLDEQRDTALARIQASTQKNLDGFDIQIRLPKPKALSLDTSVAGMLSEAVEEKTKRVSSRRRKKSMWGWVCEKLDTDDWGYEKYSYDKGYYAVDLNRVSAAALGSADVLFKAADIMLSSEIYPQLSASADGFFAVFREKIEHIRGDLLQGVAHAQQDEAQKGVLSKIFQELATDAANVLKDATAVQNQAEELFAAERV